MHHQLPDLVCAEEFSPSSRLEQGAIGGFLTSLVISAATNPAKPQKQLPKRQPREQRGWGKAVVTAKEQKFGLKEQGALQLRILVIASGFISCILGFPPLCGIPQPPLHLLAEPH